MKFVISNILFSFFLLSSLLFAENNDNDPIFPTPAILKDNVAFWIKIYTDVSMEEGLLHDRDYPLVIFERMRGESSSKKVKLRKKQIVNALRRIASIPESNWTEYEKSIVDLYKKHADSSALKGADDRVRFQKGQKERYQEGLRRSGMYLDTIRAILRKYKVPLRLAYLPHVESSFNTEAYSKVGAAGLWQFMRGTGKVYGMRINYTIDERRDPVTATDGAARYLSSSYKQLGTWPLAITSYNHGVTGMKRAVRQTGSKDIAVIIQKYKSRSFRFASSNFYSCFLAASSIAADYKKYFPGITLYPPHSYHDFTLEHYISADDFCTFLDIPREQLMRLNPAIRPAVFAQHQRLPKGFALHVPKEKSIITLTSAYKAIPDSLKMNEPPRPKYYRVRRGDNLYAISNRLGVSVKEIAFENNITRLNRIRAGQVLRIPIKPGKAVKAKPAKPTAPPEEVAVAEKVTTQPSEASIKKQAAEEIAMAETQAKLPPEEVVQVVREKIKHAKKEKEKKEPQKQKTPSPKEPEQPPLSDSLKEIAFAAAIIEPEKTTTEKPRIAPSFDVSIYNLDAVVSSVGTSAKIIVTVDETIGHYADWLGIPTWRIRKLNDMGRRSNIRIGRKLLIPIDQPDALEQFAAARLEYHMAIEEDFYMQYTVSDVTSYTLKRGEALWDICNNNENPLPLWLFRKYNRHLDLNRLFVGSEVWIPQVRELTEEEIRSFSTNIPTPPVISVPPHIQQLNEVKRVP